MKKYAYYIITVFFISLIGCEKDMFVEQPAVANTGTTSLKYYTQNRKTLPVYSGVNEKNGLIRFDDGETFERTVRLLMAEDERINDQFIDEFRNLEEQALEEKEIELGFDEDIALMYFENQFSHQSLRASIRQDEEAWLDNPELDPATDPNNHVIHDRVLKTIVNEDSEVMIGGSIFKIMQSGAVYEIRNGDFNTADQIKEIHATVEFQAPNVMLHNAEELGSFKSSSHDCRMLIGRKSSFQHYNSGNRRYRGYLGIRNFYIYGAVLSTTTSYYRKNGRWKKKRASIRTKNWGQVSLNRDNCNVGLNNYSSATKSKYRRHVEKRYIFWIGFGQNTDYFPRTKSGWLQSNHYCSGNNFNYTLSF